MRIFRSGMVQMNINAIQELQKQIDSYDIKVGVFENVPRKKPISGAKAKVRILAGGPVRASTAARVPVMSGDLAEDLQSKFRWLTKPFSRSATVQTKEIVAFTKYFMVAIAQDKKDALTLRRIANLVQAIVRNPILRGDYGTNSAQYAKLKGFNRFLIDTGQFFRSIKAVVK